MCCDVIEENQKIIFSSGWQLDVNGSNDCMSTSTSSVSCQVQKLSSVECWTECSLQVGHFSCTTPGVSLSVMTLQPTCSGSRCLALPMEVLLNHYVIIPTQKGVHSQRFCLVFMTRLDFHPTEGNSLQSCLEKPQHSNPISWCANSLRTSILSTITQTQTNTHTGTDRQTRTHRHIWWQFWTVFLSQPSQPYNNMLDCIGPCISTDQKSK